MLFSGKNFTNKTRQLLLIHIKLLFMLHFKQTVIAPWERLAPDSEVWVGNSFPSMVFSVAQIHRSFNSAHWECKKCNNLQHILSRSTHIRFFHVSSSSSYVTVVIYLRSPTCTYIVAVALIRTKRNHTFHFFISLISSAREIPPLDMARRCTKARVDGVAIFCLTRPIIAIYL